MFLSTFVSYLEPDGSLVVDLADEGGPVVRFGPVAAGMSWARRSGERWVSTGIDWGVLLLNRAHESRRDLPVLRYLSGVPEAITAPLYALQHLQTTALRLCARWPEASQLAHTNLPLLWLVAERHSRDASWRGRLPALLRRPQPALLEAVLDAAVRPAQVRFLRKLAIDVGDRPTLERVLRVVADEDGVMRLRHWSRVPSGLLEALLDLPALADRHWLRTLVGGVHPSWALGQMVRERQTLLRDTASLARMLGRPAAVARAITRTRGWGDVRVLHDALLEVLPADEEGAAEADIDPALVFGAPPIPSDARFSAIESVGELFQEGRDMHHCAATRASDVLSGTCYLYRVQVAGQRGTLEVGLGPGGEPRSIEEFRLACNGEPSAAAWAVARAWVSEGRARRLAERRKRTRCGGCAKVVTPAQAGGQVAAGPEFRLSPE